MKKNIGLIILAAGSISVAQAKIDFKAPVAKAAKATIREMVRQLENSPELVVFKKQLTEAQRSLVSAQKLFNQDVSKDVQALDEATQKQDIVRAAGLTKKLATAMKQRVAVLDTLLKEVNDVINAIPGKFTVRQLTVLGLTITLEDKDNLEVKMPTIISETLKSQLATPLNSFWAGKKDVIQTQITKPLDQVISYATATETVGKELQRIKKELAEEPSSK